MSAEHDLETLIRSMQPVLQPGQFVFATVPAQTDLSTLEPQMVFREAEGLTLILEQQKAKANGIDVLFPSRMITLNVHSALDAVGFMARVATALAADGISVNPVAGYYHDHLFVPDAMAERAMASLQRLACG